jgi:hypothetical protein
MFKEIHSFLKTQGARLVTHVAQRLERWREDLMILMSRVWIQLWDVETDTSTLDETV